MADVVKQVFSVFCIVFGVAAFYYFSDAQLLYRVLGLLLVLVLASAMFFTTKLGQGLWMFILEAKLEIRKVVWPTREETVRTTLLVFAMVVVVGLLLGILDKLLFEGIRLLTGQKG